MKKNGKIDLHLHSSASDGIHDPKALIRLVAEAGLAAAALTDHDTIAGLEEAFEAGKRHGFEVVPGVEISVIEEGRETHILGYYPGRLDLLAEAMSEKRLERLDRMEMMVARLKELGFKITIEEVLAEAKKAAPGRLHLARILLRKNYIHSLDQAFSLYIGRNRPAYVPRRTAGLAETISMLLETGAIPVLAHPGKNGRSVLERLLDYGLKGIEVYHPDHSPGLVKYYLNLAAELNLLITGGSDYHGEAGDGAEQYPLELAIAEKYLARLKWERFGEKSFCPFQG